MTEELNLYSCEGRDGHMALDKASKDHAGGEWYYASDVDPAIAQLKARVEELEGVASEMTQRAERSAIEVREEVSSNYPGEALAIEAEFSAFRVKHRISNVIDYYEPTCEGGSYEDLEDTDAR